MTRLRTAFALVGATLCTLAGVALPTTASATVEATPAAPKKLFTISDDRIKESSGLAKSVKHPGTYYTVNDSGDTGRVFAIDGTTGKVEAVLRFGAKVTDVEALGVDRDGTIYIADIGDNKASRDQIEIYTIPEPATLEDADLRYHQFDFKYPDGAHDAETLLIEPGTSQLYIVTKELKGTGGIYAAPPAPSRQGTNDLSKLAPAPSGIITDGTFMPDGQRVVLRTYTDVATVAWGETPNVVARGAAVLGQGETVAVGPTDNTVLVGSEGANSAVYQMTAPAKAVTSTPPSAGATPKPATTSDSSNSDSGKSHNLRWIIIGATLFALIITIVTFPPGRRERRDRQAENDRLTGQSPPTGHRRPHV
ncbi:esterase-like activity of phytase family protein [Kribbella soli]